ncbi:MAG: MDR family oxidoreductase [Steroidobacteraceae bacterium]
MFRALVTDNRSGTVTATVQELAEAALPAGDVRVAVEYSSLNYKDGLVVNGAGGLVKNYPHVPGIDFAGTVLESRDSRWKSGDKVVLTGWRVGEVQWGGFAQRAQVSGDWLVRLPTAIDAHHAMAIGTAGFTAMLAVMALEAQGKRADSGEMLVTGAAGGVGSIATAILAQRGFHVVASTGRADAHEFLRGLGAREIIDRSAFAEPAKRPLESERWAACIDSVGGNTLSRVLAQMRYGGSVAAVGLAGGAKLEHSVIPFILRSVNLLGIDSVMCPMPRRLAAWTRLQVDLPREALAAISIDARLDELPRLARAIVAGQVRGRVVIDVNA